MKDGGPRRVGWLLVALGVVALGGLGAYAANNVGTIAPKDPTWRVIAGFASPFLAALSGVAIGVLLVVAAGLGLVEVKMRRAANATGFGCIVAPVLYFISLFVLTDFLDSLGAGAAWAWAIYALPIAIGIATVLGYVLRSRDKPTRAGPATSPPE